MSEVTSKLNWIIEQCKGNVTLEANAHRASYVTVENYLNDYLHCEGDIDPDVRQKMIEQDKVIDLSFYPDTPIGFFNVYHYDVDLAINEAWELLKSEQTK